MLLPQGHVVLATSRPAGIPEDLFRGVARLHLSPLSEDQQRQAIEQRIGRERARALVPYLSSNVPLDLETKQRITANPLMLSMVVSIFEIRSGVNMPRGLSRI